MASESTTSSGPRTPGTRTTAVLVPQGALAGRPDIPLDRAVTTIGSSETSRLHLISRTVSKSHALLVNSNGGTYVADVASRTGVLVNGKVVHDVELKTGDRVQIGKFLFRYRAPTTASAVTRVEPPAAAIIVVGSPAVPITGRIIAIGRRETSEVPLAGDAAVSAAHAVIFQVDGKWVIRDLGSRTGTLINARKVNQQALSFGDRIQIGSATILFQPAKAPIEQPAASVAEEELAPIPVEEMPLTAEAPEPVVATVAGGEPIEAGIHPEPEPLPIEPALGHAIIAQEAIASDEASIGFAPAPDSIESAIPVKESLPIAVDSESPAAPNVHESEATAESPAESTAEPVAAAEAPADPLAPIEFAGDAVEAEALATLAELPPEAPVYPPIEITGTAVNAEPPTAIDYATTLPVSDAHEPIEFGDTAAAESSPAAETITEPAIEPIEFQTEVASARGDEESVDIEPHLAVEAVAEHSTPPTESILPVEFATEDHPSHGVSDAAADHSDEHMESVVEPSEPDAELIIPVELSTEDISGHEITGTVATDHPIDETTVPTEVSEQLPIDLPEQAFVEPEPVVEVAAPPSEETPAVEINEPGNLGETLPVEPAEIPAVQTLIDQPIEVPESANEQTAEIEPLSEVDLATPSTETENQAAHSTHSTHSEPMLVEPVENSDAVAEPAAPVEVEKSGTAAAELPAVIFWGDPELDAEAERAILGSTETPPAVAEAPAETTSTAPEEPAEIVDVEPVVVVPVELASAAPERSTEATDSVPTPIAADLNGPSSISEPEPIDRIEDIAFGEPEIAGDSAVSAVETVFGEVVPVPVDDFSPEGTVSITSDAPAGESHAVVDELMFGDEESPVVATDEAATVTESLTTELPETEELMTGNGIDAPIEGIDEVSTADVPVVDDSSEDDLIWMDDASPVAAVDDLSLGVGPATRIVQVLHVAPTDTPTVETFSASEIEEGTEDDLEFLDFSDEPAAETHRAVINVPEIVPVDNAEVDNPVVSAGPPQPEPVAEDKSPEKPAETLSDFVRTEEPKPRPGPSLFGFDFEGGSFLGGMPLQLNATTTAATAGAAGAVTTTAAAAGKVASAMLPASSSVFDVQSRTPSGLGGKLAKPPTVRSRSSAPTEKSTGELPRPIPRPTPPRPTGSQGRIDAPPMSLMDLGTETRSRPAGPPEIPPTVKEVARGNNTADAAPTAGSKTSGSNKKPVSLDVFSQVSSPIGVEVFGGKRSTPELEIPDAKETREKFLVENPVPEDEEVETAASAPVTTYTPPPRRSRIPMLLLMIPLFIIASGVAIFTLVPSSANIVGTLKFSGVSSQNAHDWWYSQKKRLREPGIRNTAREILVNSKKPTGFTDDPIAYDHAIENVSWPGSDTFQFDYFSYDPKAGIAQVNAVLEALRSADKDLDDAKARALDARDRASDARKVAHDAVDTLVQQEKVQRQLAQDTTDAATLSQLDREAARLKQVWSDAKTSRDTTASVLAGFRAQDPAKPIDLEHDDQVISLKQKLDQVNDQIAKAKAAAASTGAVPDNTATTQPSDALPILSVLQPEADRYSLMLKHRQEELAAEAALTPDQRAANLQNLIENMSVKLTTLDRSLAEAKEASDQATAAADAAHKRDDAARIAGANLDDLLQQQQVADVKLTAAVADEKEKQAALDACVTVVPDSPISVEPEGKIFDPQWPIWGGFSGLVVLVIGLMIWGEATRPQIVPGETPVAAPLRTIPWPKADQLEGLNDSPVQTQEPERYIGV